MNWTLGSEPIPAFGIDLAIKASALLTLAWMAHGLLGRRRVLLRSALWNGCVAGLLALPVALLVIPNRPWPIEADLPSFPTSAVESPSLDPTWIEPETPVPSPTVATGVEIVTAPTPTKRFDWGRAVVNAYGLGLLVMLARLVIAWWATARIRRQSAPVESAEWLEALARWRERIGYRGSIELLATTRPLAPLAFGWLRPTIVVPVELIDQAKPAAIDAILLHELGHLQRNDYVWNFLLRVSQAVYWPLPLAWPLSRVVDGVRERACDAFCVYWLGGAGDYGETLVDVASRLSRGPTGALGLSMARSPRLGKRLVDLSRTIGRATCRPRLEIRVAAVGLTLAAVCLVGPLRRGTSAVAENVGNAEAVEVAQDDPPTNQAEQTRPVADPAKTGEQIPKSDPKPAAEPEQEAAPTRKYRAVVVKVQKGDYQEEITAQCTLEARETATVSAELTVPLRVGDVEVKLGDTVKKGQRLFRYRRQGDEHDEIKTSPINGVVTRLTAQSGMEVTPGNFMPDRPMVEVTDSSEILVTAEAPEEFAPKIQRGQGAKVSAAGFDETFPAKVTVPVLAIDPSTRKGAVHLVVPNPEGKLLPGSSGQVRLEGQLLHDVLLVPKLAMPVRLFPIQLPGSPAKAMSFCRVRKGEEGQPARFDLVHVQRKGQTEQAFAVMPGQGLEEGDLLVSNLEVVLGRVRGSDQLAPEKLDELNRLGPGDVEIKVLSPDEIRLHLQAVDELRANEQERMKMNPTPGGRPASGGGFR